VRYLILFILCLLTACTRQVERSSFSEGVIASRNLVGQYGEVQSKEISAYLDSIIHRLNGAMMRQKSRYAMRPFEVKVLATRIPIAASPGGGMICVSSGLIVSLRTEAELAFVFAHEMSHEYLGHLARVQNNPVPDDQLKKMEEEADDLGIGMMSLAGYDPRGGIAGLLNSYHALARSLGSASLNVPATSHPDVEARIQKLQLAIERSRWLPPGTLDRRDFQKIRRALASVP
jgi:predicted Zn-dependent protease